MTTRKRRGKRTATKGQPHVALAVDEESRDPFKVTFTGSSIEISGRIASEADADTLIKAVTALKLLLQSPTEVRYPEKYESEGTQDEE